MTLMFGPVYLVYDHIRHERCSPPLKAFSTEEAAKAYCNRKNDELNAEDPGNDKTYNWTRLEIME